MKVQYYDVLYEVLQVGFQFADRKATDKLNQQCGKIGVFQVVSESPAFAFCI